VEALKHPPALFVTDIDNTVFDWVSYYACAFAALLEKVSDVIGVDYQKLAQEAQTVFSSQASIEYPFLIQELPSVITYYGTDIEALLSGAVALGRRAFLDAAERQLFPYPHVDATFKRIKKTNPELPIVALTDAPRYVAMWKLNKLGLLSYFDAVYGLADPRIPVCPETNLIKVDAEILRKHLQQYNFGYRGRIRVLPEDYEKPGTKGLKTVLMDFDLDETKETRSRVLWLGDNLRKDMALGKRLGVKCAWAAYGVELDKAWLAKLSDFSPSQNIHKNVNIDPADPNSPEPDFTVNSFEEIAGIIETFGSF
jgi:phosphoglycolate phosphatase